jgi:hypothetical protein
VMAWRRRTKATVKSKWGQDRWSNNGHMMIWSGSYHLVIGWCMCYINVGGDGMECARQRYNHRTFPFHRS